MWSQMKKLLRRVCFGTGTSFDEANNGTEEELQSSVMYQLIRKL